MTEPVPNIQGPSSINPAVPAGGSQPSAAVAALPIATASIASSSVYDPTSSYQVFVPQIVRDKISSITDPETRLEAEQEAVRFFSGQTIYRYTGTVSTGKALSARFTLDNGDQSYLYMDNTVPQFAALEALFKHGITSNHLTSSVRDNNLSERLTQYLTWRRDKLAADLEEAKSAEGEMRTARLQMLVTQVRGLCDLLEIDLTGKNLDVLEQLEEVIGLIKGKMTDVPQAGLLETASAVLAADSGASREDVADLLNLIKQDRLRLAFKDFGPQLYQLDRQDLSVSYSSDGSTETLNIQGIYVWHDDPMTELTPFLKIMGEVLFGEGNAQNVAQLCSKINTPARKGIMDVSLYAMRVAGAQPGDIDGTPNPSITVFYSVPVAPNDTFDYIVASGDDIYRQSLGGAAFATANTDERYDFINELLRQAGVQGQDFATRVVTFYNQHAAEILGLGESEVSEDAVNFAQNMAFNAYLKGSINDLNKTERIIEQALDLAQIQDPEERCLLYVILAALSLGTDTAIGGFKVTANGEGINSLSQESLQLIIDQVHQFYLVGGEVGGEPFPALATSQFTLPGGRSITGKELIRMAFRRFDRQSPALESGYLALLTLAKELAGRVQPGAISMDEVVSAAGLSLYGIGDRPQPPGNREVVLQELNLLYEEVKFQNSNVVPNLGSNYNEVKITPQFMEVLIKVAEEHSTERNIPFYTILEGSSLYRLAQQLNGDILDPLWILIQYVLVLGERGQMSLSDGFEDRMNKFLAGEEMISNPDLLILLNELNKPAQEEYLQQALDVLAMNEDHGLPTPAFMKMATSPFTDPWYISVDQTVDGNVELAAAAPTAPPAPIMIGAGEEVTLRADVEDISVMTDERIANLWLLIFDRDPSALTPAERQMFTAAGIEIPMGLDPEERSEFLENLHSIPAFLSANAIDGLVNIMNERYILYSPVNYTGYGALQRLYDGGLTLRLDGQVVNLTQAQKDLIRRVLLMRQEEGNVNHRILSAADKQALLALKQYFYQAGLSLSDSNVLVDIRDALTQLIDEDNLVVINQPIEGLSALTEFAQKLRSGYFKVNGVALQGVANLEVPEGVTHASEYLNYINILKAISDSLSLSTFVEPAPVVGAWNNFTHAIQMGVEQSSMTNDPDVVLSGLPQGIVRDFKILMYFDCLQNLIPEERMAIENGNQLIEERNALLIEREQIKSQLAQGQAVSHLLTDNTSKLVANAEAFSRLLGISMDGEHSLTDDLEGLLDAEVLTSNDPALIGLRLAYLKFVSAGLMSLADAKELQKEKDFEAGVDAILVERFNNDPAKRNEAKQAYLQSEAYRLLDEAFQDSIRPINLLRDTYETEFGTLSRYVQSDEVDQRFMDNFFRLFAGNQSSDYGIFEWNFEPTATAAGTHMLFTDAAGNELGSGQELFNYVKQVFEQISGGHWASMSRLPSDTNLAVIKAKQIMAYVLMNMPVNEVQIDVANAVINSASSILQHKIPFLGKLSILLPIAVGVGEWAMDEAGLDTTTTVGPTSLDSLQYYVNTEEGRMKYQAAQMAQGISVPDTQWRQSMGGMAQLIFSDGLDFEAGQSSFDSMRQIDSGIVNNAIEAYTRIMNDVSSSAAMQGKIDHLREEGKVTIGLGQFELDALKALEEFLLLNNLQVNLYDPLNAASALDGISGVTEKIKYGLFVLSQLTLEISEIESQIYPQTVLTSEDQLLNPLMGFAPNSILRRYLIEGEGENRQITIVRVDPTDPNKHLVTNYRPASLSEHFSSFLDTVSEGASDLAHTVSNPDDLNQELGDALEAGLIEGLNFKFMIPINIFSGFASDSYKASEAYLGLQAQIEATNDPYEKARLQAEAEMLKKRFWENVGHTIGSFVAFENWPEAILAQWWYLMTHDQLGRGIGYGLIVLPFAAQIISSRLRFAGEFANFFRGKPVAYAQLTQYGLMSVPLGAVQKGMYAVARRGWNNNFVTRGIDAALSWPGNAASNLANRNRVTRAISGAFSYGLNGLGSVYNAVFHNPYVRAVTKFFNINWGGWSDFTTITHGQHAGLASQAHSAIDFAHVMLKTLKTKFKAELRAYLEQRGVTGPALELTVDEAWNAYKQSMSDPQAMAEMGLEPLGTGQQLNIMRSQMMGAYSEIINRESVRFILKKVYGENIPPEVMNGLLQIVTQAEALDGRIRSAEASGASHSQLEILRAQRAQISNMLDAFIQSVTSQMDSEALKNKFDSVIRNNLNRENFTINQDVKMKVGNKSAIKAEIKARLAEIRAKFFETLVPRIQQMARSVIDHMYGPTPPSTPNTPTSGGTPAPQGPAAPVIRPAEIFSGLIYEGAIGAEFDSISAQRLVEFKAMLEAKGVKIKINIENGLRLSEADFASLKMSIEALQAVEGRTYRLVIRDGGYIVVYPSGGNLEVMVARGNFIGTPSGGGSGGGLPVAPETPVAVLPGMQPNTPSSSAGGGAVEGNLALQLQPETATELPPNPYDPLVQRGIVVGRDGFVGVSTETMAGFADEMVARKVEFISFAEGVTISEADLARLLDTIPSGNPKGGSVPGLGKPTGRAIIVLGPDMIYSVSLYEGMTVENVGNSFRFMHAGEMVASYELRAFEFAQTEMAPGQLAIRLNADISSQLEKITLRVSEMIGTTWNEVLEKIRGEGGVEFLQSAKGKELVRYFGQNAGLNAASLVVGAIQVLGFDYLADALGIENPGLRMLFVIGNMHALTPVTQALLTGSFNLPTISNLAKQTFLTTAGWSSFYRMMGNMYVGGQIYSGVLNALGWEDSILLNNTLVNMGMSWAIPEAAGALTSYLLTRFGASTALRVALTGVGTKIIPLIGWTSLAVNGAMAALVSYFDAGDIMAMGTLVNAEYANRHPDFDSGIDPWDIAGVISDTAGSAIMSASIPVDEFKQIQQEILQGFYYDSTDIINNITEHLTSASLAGVVDGLQGLQEDLAQNGYWTDFAQDFVGDYTMARQAMLEKMDELFYNEASQMNGLDDDYDAMEAPEIGEGIVLVANLFNVYRLIKTNSNPGTYDLTAIERFLSFFNENGTVKDRSALANYMMDGVAEDLEAIDSMRRAMRMQYLIFNPSEMSGYDETMGLVTAIAAGYDPTTGEPWTQYMVNTNSSAYTNALESLKETNGENIQNRLIDFIGLALQNGGQVPVEVITDIDVMLGLVFADGTLNRDSLFYVDASRAARGEERIAFRAAQLIQLQLNKIFTAQVSGMPILEPGEYSQLDIDLGLLTADKKLKVSNPLYAIAMEELREAWRNEYNEMSAEEKIARRAMVRILFVKSGFSPLVEELLKAYGDQSFIAWAKQGSHTVQVLELEERLEEATSEGFAVYDSGEDAAELNPVAQNIVINSILQEVVSLGQ